VTVTFLLFAASIGITCEDIMLVLNVSATDPAGTIFSSVVVSPKIPSLFCFPKREVGPVAVIVVFLLLTESIGSTIDEITSIDILSGVELDGTIV
jgi:hypothetical protein